MLALAQQEQDQVEVTEEPVLVMEEQVLADILVMAETELVRHLQVVVVVAEHYEGHIGEMVEEALIFLAKVQADV